MITRLMELSTLKTKTVTDARIGNNNIRASVAAYKKKAYQILFAFGFVI